MSGGYYVLPEHVLKGKDFNTVWNRGGIVGSGPFTLESFTPDVRAVLARDPDYWGRRGVRGRGPFLDRLVINFLDSSGAAITALRQGEAQMTSPPPDPALIARAAAIDGVEVQSVPVAVLRARDPQHPGGPARRPARAAGTGPRHRPAADRQRAARRIGAGAPEHHPPVPDGQHGGLRGLRLRPRPAASLLEQAGWTRGADGIFAEGRARISRSRSPSRRTASCGARRPS